MNIINVNRPVSTMLEELKADLNKSDLVLVERIPHIKETERYRDVVSNTLKEFGIALVLIRLMFKDGSSKGYAFLMRVINEASGIAEVEGFIIENRQGARVKRIYDKESISIKDLIPMIVEFAELYRRAEERIIQLGLVDAYRGLSIFY